VDTGDYIIVINAERIVLTGQKWDDKLYQRHTGYMGGLKEMSYRKLIQRHPTLPVREAVRRMLPKSILGRQMLRKLKIYAGPVHPHSAQEPKDLEI
jgi:large subunit ribosomal protein L13